MKIAIIGASGIIGGKLYHFLKKMRVEVFGTSLNREKPDFAKFDLLHDDFSIFDNCTHVVICAGISKIDDLVRFKEKAYALNVTITIKLIEYLSNLKIVPVFLSSDQVFDGEKGNYREEDPVNPVNLYGKYKVMVEEYLRENVSTYLVLRLSKTYSTDLNDKDWFSDIVTRLKNGEVIKAAADKIYNPTDVRLVCLGTYLSIKERLANVYHLAQPRIMSSLDFVLATAKEYGYSSSRVEKVSFLSCPMLEKRALNSSLNVEKIHKRLGAHLADLENFKYE